MGTIFTLTPAIKAIAQAAIDDLINQLGKTCRLYYPPRQVQCNNCIFNPVGSKSSGVYLDGGPSPFPPGSLCPLCSGKGTISSQTTDLITMLCAWSPKDFFVPTNRSQAIVVPEGRIQTKGFAEDLPKIMQAAYMLIETDIEPRLRCKFKRAGDPIDQSNIIQGRYFVMQWDRYA